MENKRVMKLASRGKRFGAYCIDAIVPVFNIFLMFIAMGALSIRSSRRYGFGNDFGYGWGNGFGNGFGNDFGYGWGDGFGNGFGNGYGYDGGRSTAVISVLFVIVMLLSIAYMAVQMIFFAKSKTMGKAALGLQVISSQDGKPIGFWRMLLREWIVKKASAHVFYLGFIWILIDDKNRGWHDKILDTYVIDLKESSKLNRKSETETAATINHESDPEDATQTAVTKAINEPVDFILNDKVPAEFIELEEDSRDEKDL